MKTRTSKKVVTFRRPFILGGFDEELPAGAYSVETDEELLEGISFAAYRRVSTLLHLHPKPGRSGLSEILTVDPNELDAAHARDRASLCCSRPTVPDRAELPANQPDGGKTWQKKI